MRVAYVLGDARAMEPLIRAMNCVRTLQQGTPAAGWADQYYLDLTPAKARDFEPAAVSTVRTRDCIRLLMAFYRLTGDRKFLDGIPAALDFLRAAALDDAAAAGLGRKPGKGRLLCPRFVKPGTLTPLYMHRKGLHVDNGAYYIDQDPHNVIGHYAALVVIDARRPPAAVRRALRPSRGRGYRRFSDAGKRAAGTAALPYSGHCRPPIRRTREPSSRRSTAKAAGSGR